MSMALEDLAKEAIQLSNHQRLALAGFLLEIDESPSDPEADSLWDREIRARIQEIDTGAVAGIPYAEVMREADRRIAP
ncbi:MAG: addiction module protein [Terrimicrobiaceae bacterium]|nr:addiction module protein [Terrimicrobiaceae bacterium]